MIKGMLGSLHKDLYFSNREIPSVDGQAAIQPVCAVCDIDKEVLFTVRRGVGNIPKDIAMYVLRAHCRKKLKEIGAVPECNRYNTVSTVISRFEFIMEGNVTVRDMHVLVCREMKISRP